MKRKAKLDKKTALRFKSLGEAGEDLTVGLLQKNGFTNIQNLNLQKANFPFADFYAEKDGVAYVISVKARNKYEFTRDGSKKLNSRYKLGSKCYEHAITAESKFKAQAAWLTICLDSKTFCAYFGLLSSLNGSRGINMSEKAVASYQHLAKDQSHDLKYEKLKNIYEMKSQTA